MKVFGKWDVSEIEIEDLGIRQYANLKQIITPHTGGRVASQQFSKSSISIVERLINKMMRKERSTGQKQKTFNIVRGTFEILHNKTGKNPVHLLVKAIENAGPREEVIRLRYGGISVPKSVDTSTQRRIDQALMFIAQGAQKAAFKSKRSIEECLASEIIAAVEYDVKSYAIGKKEERERVAKAAR